MRLLKIILSIVLGRIIHVGAKAVFPLTVDDPDMAFVVGGATGVVSMLLGFAVVFGLTGYLWKAGSPSTMSPEESVHPNAGAKYYIRKPASHEFRGPYTVDEIKGLICENTVTGDWDATVATGQSFWRLKLATKWVRVSWLLGDRPDQGSVKDQLPSASFVCFVCGISIRLVLSEITYRCPKCGAEYQVKRVATSPLVFLLIPSASGARVRAENTADSKRPVPPHVRAALAVFGLNENAAVERIQQAYRESMKSYHPDRVSHLGADLRRLAEEKTKEFNSAWRVLKDFFAIE